jgi:dienelactone hydrolase
VVGGIVFNAMGLLDSWTAGSHTAGGITHPTYRKGSGPGVIVIHEIPGITPAVIAFAEEVVARGFSVVLPSLFGREEASATVRESLRSIARVCVSREFSLFALGRTSPVAAWLRSLARELHAELDGPGVGAVGMCLTGGFALAMLADAPVAAPVVAQPASPAPVGKARKADLGLSPRDLSAVKAKVAAGCQVLGLRYDRDPAVGARFDTLRRELGDNFIAVEFPGRKHATLTEHRQQEAVDRVLAFFEDKLKVASDQLPVAGFRGHRRARPGALKAQLQPALPCGHPLPRRGLQHPHLDVVLSRADVLDVPRPAVRRKHDLHRKRRRLGAKPHPRWHLLGA